MMPIFEKAIQTKVTARDVAEEDLKLAKAVAESRDRRPSGAALAAVLLPALLATACGPGLVLPPDAQDACPLSPATFAGWFQSGSVSLNGVANPANSLNSLTPNCGFYQWSEQMFLWLNSPAPETYGGGGGRIFDSAAFYDVSPPDVSGRRTLLAHSAGVFQKVALRAAQPGLNGLQVIMDRSGTLFSVKPPDSKLMAVVRDKQGQLVEIAHARFENRRLVLLDMAGKAINFQIANPKPSEARQSTDALVAQKFVIDRIPIFLDPFLAVVDVEQGQSDGGVLEAQKAANGSLIYYATMVNDVFAYFLTGVDKGIITTTTPNQFPTTSTDLNNIIAFAEANGKPNPPFPDPNALAIEVKSSWVEAAGLPNLSTYITRMATIPTYDRSNPNLWSPNGQKTVQLALVGMHVVGSTAGHPELVWATFEHVANTPAAAYSYNSTTGPKTVPQDTSGPWLFSANGSSGPFNQMHMSFGGQPTNNIAAINPPFNITPSDTLRSEPWGIDGSNAGSNTEIISTNNHVRGMLVGGDLRSNYVLIGATWTPFGSNPVGQSPGVGTNRLSNSTMETYQQGPVTNCFSCHQSGSSLTTAVSHIFPFTNPLF